MKKVLVFLLLGIFMFSFASAITLNNYKTYDDLSETINIRESRLGSSIVNITLISPKENKVPYGKVTKVFEFEIVNLGSKDLSDIFDKWEFYNVRDKLREKEKSLELKYKAIESHNITDYKTSCRGVNGTANYSCSRSIEGYHNEQKIVWKKINPVNLLKGQKMTIGGFAYVDKYEKTEWIFTAFGKRIDEWAVWTASLEVDLVLAYSFNETTGNFTDFKGGPGLVPNGSLLRGQDGLANNTNFSINSNSVTGLANFDGVNTATGTEATSCYWFQIDNWTSLGQIFQFRDGADRGQPTASYLSFDTDVTKKIMVWGGITGTPESSFSLGFNEPYFVCETYNESEIFYYINGVFNESFVENDSIVWGDDLWALSRDDGFGFNGSIDELYLWNRSLSDAEIFDLYDFGEGLTPWTVGPINISFVAPTPADGGGQNGSGAIINITSESATDHSIFLDFNRSILAWWNFENTNATGVFDNFSIEHFMNFSDTNFGEDNLSISQRGQGLDFDGSTDWLRLANRTASDFTGLEEGSITAWFKLDVVPSIGDIAVGGFSSGNSQKMGLITRGSKLGITFLVSGGNDIRGDTTLVSDTWYHGVITSNGTNYKIYLNGVDDGLDLQGGSLDNGNWFADTTINTFAIGNVDRTSGPVPSNYINGIIDEVMIFNRALSTEEVASLYQAGSTQFENNFTGLEDTVTYNYTAYGINEQGGINLTLNRNFTMDNTNPNVSLSAPPNIQTFVVETGLTEALNWTANDTNLDTCFYEYNLTNTTVTCGDNTTNFNVNRSELFINFWANDTAGNIANVSRSWHYRVVEINQTFNASIIEGAVQNFTANFVVNADVTLSSALFTYNNSATVPSTSVSGGITTLQINNFVVPTVTSTINTTFNFSLTMNDSTVINLTNQNQTITSVGLGNCTTFNFTLLNFTVVDEEFQTLITNASIEIAAALFSQDRSVNISNFTSSTNSTNPLALCIENPIPVGVNYSLDSVIKYFATGYSIEYYNIVNSSVTNTTNGNITLFDLNSSDATEFKITFKDADFIVVEGALINVNRQYIPEAVFKTVELPITDSNGQTVVHLVEKDIVYNFIVTKGGQVIGTFNNLIAFCDDATIGSCFISLNAVEGQTQTFDYDSELGISFNFAYNETTRDLTFTFVSDDGTAKALILNATKVDQIGTTSVCSDSVTSASGTLTCSIPASIGNSSVYTSVFVDGSLKLMQTVKAGTEINLGVDGYFLLFFWMLSLIMLFSSTKSGVVVAVILGFISGILFFLIKGSVVGSASSIVWLVIAGLILLWKLNKEGQT